ncbi:ImmA/IrrE family metallo-endopeptidase [Staphylococcus pettenkoferi]|uniref:ImmA/IrrE family metallo-endopeptidase n=1 Tax=Staphylococcus pettenkoferi TaxID=170573 RepID=UPI00066C8708|nr:ImmA/IrrE family metallo-endopeptidase [Staphylococcus pettenkoferi]MDK7114627.1 ImmA/IrrE family metallo-endopeptidase [Staphylococcus pettenkoferi]MDK7283465.1 ImmA/IrrE family metallo-endopeptidase [Staphylococcus pettenkoferi]
MTKSKLNKETKERLRHEINKVVEEFKEKYKIKKSPIQDSYALIEQLGFLIIGKHLDSNISGFTLNIGDYPCIFINRNHHFARQNQSLWHEVYHWYSGNQGHISNLSEIDYSEMEFKAENFASKILINRELLREKVTQIGKNFQTISPIDIVNLSNYFNVSYMNLMMALNEESKGEIKGYLFNLGKLENHQKLMEFIGTHKLSKENYVVPEKGYITSGYLEDLIDNLKQNKISEGYFNDIFNFINKELKIFD